MDLESALRERFRIVSLDVDRVTHGSAVERVIQLANNGSGAYVCFGTVHMVMESFDSPEFAAKVNAADMIVTDGMPLVWMQKLQKAVEPERVRANDLMMLIMAEAERKGIRVGFYGGRPEVVERMVGRAGQEHPDLAVSFAYSPPFRPLTADEDKEITDRINASGTQILFMGLGCPKQENWMAEHRDRLNCVMLGVGASFDFYAGNVKESPAWLGRLGLEWLYRLVQEPKRLWRRYLILNPRFIWHAARQLLSQN
ncbi:MAG TPA: WecB/TagA/CpsF family glycosyltransferase [Pyrinomonadaceae bacterium]|nr:WecB/TagA/CpsF family glycosyltransferase [Pyrinomonadaceae bacterium]